MTIQERLAHIEAEIKASASRLRALDTERTAARTMPAPLETAHPMLAKANMTAKSYTLVAQGDSWFDYPTSWDVIDWLQEHYQHKVKSIAVAGSTLNDIVYGPVPKNWLGIPQSDDTSRSAELINLIDKIRPQAVLLSGGGNDIAGPEFFSFVNNALSGLQNPNQEVLDGVVNATFTKAYTDLIELILAKAAQLGLPMHIFLHGYDYPFPDGRGFSAFNIVGPWFHDTFNKKNFPYDEDDANADAELKARRDILVQFMDSFNRMVAALATKFAGTVHYVDLRGTLPNHSEWANELHPMREGFGKFAEKIDFALHTVLK